MDKPFAEEGYALMGAAFEVHNVVGGGLREEVYQQCLDKELELRRTPFATKQALDVIYMGERLEVKFIPDLIVNEQIVVELKAVSSLISDHESQLMNYMPISRSPVGNLINFGPIGNGPLMNTNRR